MPSGRNFIVERVEDGMRKVVSEVTLSGEYLVLEEPDHVHFLIGSAEELKKFAPAKARGTNTGSTATDVNLTVEVSKPKRKSTAKKSTAKKAT